MKPLRILLFLSLLLLLITSQVHAQARPAASPRIDQYGAKLPAGAVQRLGDPREVFRAVGALAVSPDGRVLAAGHYSGVLHLWSLRSARELHRLPAHQYAVAAVAFSPDGSALASAGDDGMVRLWDWRAGRETRRLAASSKPLAAVAFSADGQVLAAGGKDAQVYLWDPRTGKSLRQLNAAEEVRALAFSADGRSLAVGTFCAGENHPVRVWNFATGHEQFAFGSEHGTVNAVAFSPDGRTLASANHRDTIDLVEVATGRLIRTFQGHQGYVKCVAFSSDGRTLASSASGGGDFGIRLWEVATGQRCREFHNPGDYTFAVAFTPDGRTLISGGQHMSALVWPLDRKEDRPLAAALPSPGELEAMWEALQQTDAARAHTVIWTLAARPESSSAFLRQKLRPVQAVSVDARLLANLDSVSFQEREEAMARLERLPRGAAPALRQVLAQRPGGEVGGRLELVLQKLDPAGQSLRELRALQALELIGNREARGLLEKLAGGAPGVALTQEARAVLARLERRAAAALASDFRKAER